MSTKVLGGVFAFVLILSAAGAPIASASNDHKDINGRGNAYGHSKHEAKDNHGHNKKHTDATPSHQNNENKPTEKQHNDSQQSNNGRGKDNHVPVTICHKTGSQHNPYVIITVDDDAITQRGHDQHHSGGDIIPPFVDDEGNQYPGKNWTAAGYDACKKAATPVQEEDCEETPVDVVKEEDKSDDKETPAPVVPETTDKTPTEKPEVKDAPVKTEAAKTLPESLPYTGGFSAGIAAIAAIILAAAATAISYAVRSKLTKQSQL